MSALAELSQALASGAVRVVDLIARDNAARVYRLTAQ